MSDEKMEPCPFCGGANPIVCQRDDVEYREPGEIFYQVACAVDHVNPERGCGASTKLYGRREDAISDWNRRAPTAQERRQVVEWPEHISDVVLQSGLSAYQRWSKQVPGGSWREFMTPIYKAMRAAHIAALPFPGGKGREGTR